MIPNFLIIGQTKCATTTLWSLLGDHPQIFMCDPKEPHYFSVPERYAQGIQWYESLFEGAGDAIAIGEASASYAGARYGQVASERIFETLPNARLIYCVRHPLRRIESAWIDVRCRPYTARRRKIRH